MIVGLPIRIQSIFGFTNCEQEVRKQVNDIINTPFF